MIDEEKPKLGRPRKTPFVSVLSAEQISEIQNRGLTQEQKEKREAERLRGIARRKENRIKAATAGIETKEALWELNRKLLSPSDLSDLLEQQERVLDQVHWVNGVLAGNNSPDDDPDFVSIEDGAVDLREFVKTCGEVRTELVLVPEFWKNAELYQRYQGSDANSIFARFGVVTGMPSHKVHQFNQYLAHLHPTAPTPEKPPTYATLNCACDSITGQRVVSLETAEQFRDIPYKCPQCLRKEIAVGKISDENKIFDTWGRVKL